MKYTEMFIECKSYEDQNSSLAGVEYHKESETIIAITDY